MEPSSDATPASMPIGRSGRLEALALTAAGDHAVLVREAGDDGRGRLVVMPLDEEVEVRVDGDALAVWLGAGSLMPLPADQRPMPDATHVPPWATVIGGALLLLVLAFAVIGSAVAFTWLTRVLS